MKHNSLKSNISNTMGTIVCAMVPMVLLVVVFFTVPLSVHAATIGKPNNLLLQSGLVGWWTFDANEMSPNVRDRSGQGNHGRISGQTATTTAPGEIGQALFFDGLDDVVVVSPASSINDLPAMTVSFWARPSSLGTQRPYVTKADNSAGGHGWSIGHHTGIASSLYFQVPGFTTSDLTVATPSGAFVLNEWAHYIATWDGTNQTSGVHLYKNGVELSYQTVSNGGSASPQSDAAVSLKIGRESGYSSNYVHGLVDDVRLYNRVLSASEITALYKIGSSKVAGTPTAGSTSLGGLNSGLVGHWTFDVSDVNWQSGAISNRGSSTYPAYLFGMSTTTSPRSGHSGQSLYFNGSNSFARTELIDNTHFISALDQPHSMFAWVYRSATTSNMSIVSYGEFDDLSLSTGIGIIGGKFAWIRNGVTTYTLSPFDVPVDRWTFVGVVRTSGSLTTFYMNASSTVVSGSISSAVDASDPFTIGSAYRNAAREGNFLGRIDDVRVYNRNVSSVEAQQLYVIGATKLGVSTPTGSSLSSGLVGHWTFDAPDMIPNVRDRSGQGNHGNLIGQTATTTAVGKLGQAMSFDGVNDLVNAGSATSLDNLSTWTACSWVYIRSASTPIDVLTKTSVIDGAWYLYFDYNGANASFQAYQDFDVAGAYATSQNGVIRFKQWAHICSRFDTSDSQDIRLYLNGSEVSSYLESGNASGNKIDDSTRNIGIGGNVTNSSRYFNGLLDDVRLYNRALSASEIRQLYNLGR